jgi:hypothetical protein
MLLSAFRLSPMPSRPVSAPLLWLCLTKDWRLAVGADLVPSIPAFRLVRDYSQHAQCPTFPS